MLNLLTLFVILSLNISELSYADGLVANSINLSSRPKRQSVEPPTCEQWKNAIANWIEDCRAQANDCGIALKKSDWISSMHAYCRFCPSTGVPPFEYDGYGAPLVCEAPHDADTEQPRNPNPKATCGSIIHASNQVLGEVIPIVGSSFNLMYFSDRVVGKKSAYTVLLKITKSYVPEGVLQYSVDIKDINSNIVYSNTYAPVENLQDTFMWDGLDPQGNITWGQKEFFVYTTEHNATVEPQTSHKIFVGGLKTIKLGIGSWYPSNWYFYDFVSKLLISPDGSLRPAEAQQEGSLWRVWEQSGEKAYYFDSDGKIVQVKDTLTAATLVQFFYDQEGRLVSITEPFGRTTFFNRDVSGKLTSISGPGNIVSNIELDENEYLRSVANPIGEKYKVSHTSDGLLLSYEKPNGFVSNFEYDSRGNLIKDANNVGNEVNIEKSGLGTTITSAMGVKVNNFTQSFELRNDELEKDYSRSYEVSSGADGALKIYEKTALLTMVETPKQKIQEQYQPDLRFNSEARKLSLRREESFGIKEEVYNFEWTGLNPNDPWDFSGYTRTKTVGGSTFVENYNAIERKIQRSTPLGRTSEMVIDEYRRPVTEKIGNLLPLSYSYAGINLTAIIQGERTHHFEYNEPANTLKTAVNPLNQKTTYIYDSANRLVSKILPDLRTIQYQRDQIGNVVSVTPSSKPAHLFSYRFDGKISEYIPPGLDSIQNVSTKYEYNLDGKVTRIIRPDGKSISYQYNVPKGQLEEIVNDENRVLNIYDYRGNLTRTTDLSTGQSMDFEYNGAWISKVMLFENNVRTFSYERSPDVIGGRVGSETWTDKSNSSVQVARQYDADGFLIKVGELSLRYDIPNGYLAEASIGNLQEKYYYNEYGEIVGFAAHYKNGNRVVYSYQLYRDLIGRIIEKRESIGGINTVYNYQYDSSGRLSETKRNGVLYSKYRYDGNSNLIEGQRAGKSIFAEFDNQDRQRKSSIFDYYYSANGDLAVRQSSLHGTAVSYEYDSFGNLLEVKFPNKTISYGVDPLKRRADRKVNNAITSKYLYNADGQLTSELNKNGNFKKIFVYGTSGHVPEYYKDAGGNTFKLIKDYQGSIKVVLNVNSGSIVQVLNYDDFGNTLQDTSPGQQPFGYTGGIFDSETNLVRFGARDYDPETGRWISKDPIRFEGGDTNLYGYVLQDPINNTDSTGTGPVSGGSCAFISGYQLTAAYSEHSRLQRQYDTLYDTIRLQKLAIEKELLKDCPDYALIESIQSQLAANQVMAGQLSYAIGESQKTINDILGRISACAVLGVAPIP